MLDLSKIYVCSYCDSSIVLVIPPEEPPREPGVMYNCVAKSTEPFYYCIGCRREFDKKDQDEHDQEVLDTTLTILKESFEGIKFDT